MALTRDRMLDLARARDRASDGRFVVGVVTTGIYCLPSCPARKPLPANTRFFPDEPSARAAGLRPCKRCRPDHFYRDYDPGLEAVERVAAAARRDPAAFADVGDLAAAAGLGRTKLTDLFKEHLHDSPAGFLARARVDAACRRLAGTEEPPLEVAAAVGFESASAFHENFRRVARLRPGEYRALARGEPFALLLPEAWRAEEVLGYHGRDASSGLERRRGARLEKALRLDGRPALLAIEAGSGRARCRVEGGERLRPAALCRAHAAAVRMLGLALDPEPFERRVRRLPGLSRLVRGRPGLTVPLTADPFECLVWSIVGQQVNVSFASALRTRLAELAARGAADGLRPHPTPQEVARLEPRDLAPLQFSGRKAEYLIDLARAVASGELDLEALGRGTATRAERALVARRGIGPWSANYLLLRGFGFADSVPVGDVALAAAMKAFFELDERPGPEETLTLLQPFRPWRSLACLHLWKSLGDAE